LADVAPSLGALTQIKLVASLRWRILRNSLGRKSNRLDLIGLIVAGVFGSLFVLGLSGAFYAGAYSFFSQGRESWVALLFWAIFLFWQLFPVFAAGFGAGFEFRNMLRFPLRLSAFYLIGLAYGLADFSAIASTLWLLAMAAGAATARFDVLPVMLLVIAVFILLNVTIERLLGSWLERLLARRRTRELFLGLFVLSMIGLQFIAPFLERYGSTVRPIAQRFVPYFSFLPPSLAGRAVAGDALHNVSAVLTGFAALLGYVLFFSVFLWKRFATQYRGEELSETAAPGRLVKRPAAQPAETADALSVLSPGVAAVVRKEFRYLVRNGFTFVTLLLPPLMVLLFSSAFSSPSARHRVPQNLSPEMFFPGMMAYLVLILIAPAYNSFAYEGRGIQTYYTAPVRFRDVLLGKNLLLLTVLFLELSISIVVFGFRVGLPSVPRFLATLAAIIFVSIGQLAIANWSSLSFPRKLAFGQMRNQRQSGVAALVVLGVQITMAGISAFILVAGKWTGNAWLPAEAFALLAAAAIASYFASLDPLSRLAEAKRETLIETLCR
jgi:ABC-2 type transport system permease protein